jgi:hypothetical protein
MIQQLKEFLNEIEAFAADIVAKIAPWAAPIPTAYLVGRATIKHLNWPFLIGLIAAIIVESLGLATTVTALELRDYNKSKRKSDPASPFWLAAILVGVYFIVALGLTVALDIYPDKAIFAPGIFPLLSLCGVTILALRADHGRRLKTIKADKLERKEKRQRNRQIRRQKTTAVNMSEMSETTSNNGKTDTDLDALQAARLVKKSQRLDALVKLYLDNPDIGPTEAAQHIGVRRQTIYNYNVELEKKGRIRRNDGVMEVLKR